MSATDDPQVNLSSTRALMHRAVAEGAQFVLTPEMTNAMSSDRIHLARVFRTENEDPTLPALQDEAARAGIWLLIGSLGLLADDDDTPTRPPGRDGGPRFVNRSFLVDASGAVVARYDKIHMFDVDLSETDSFRESAAYRPGDRAIVARTPIGAIGLSVCYDVRFPSLYRALAQAGATIVTVPSAFSHVTGPPHWEVLLRARAIETGSWVLAPAQTGRHAAQGGRPRRSHGHSLVVAPWGEVVADGGIAPGIVLADVDLRAVSEARRRVPSLMHDRSFALPDGAVS